MKKFATFTTQNKSGVFVKKSFIFQASCWLMKCKNVNKFCKLWRTMTLRLSYSVIFYGAADNDAYEAA